MLLIINVQLISVSVFLGIYYFMLWHLTTKVELWFPNTYVRIIERKILEVFIQETRLLNHVELVIKWIQ